MRIRRREWMLALVLAVGAHAAALAIWRGDSELSGAEGGSPGAGGGGAVRVQLVRSAAAVPAAAAPRAAQPERATQPAIAAEATAQRLAVRVELPPEQPTPAVSAAPPFDTEGGERAARQTGSQLDALGTRPEGSGSESAAGGDPGPGVDPFATPGMRDAARAYRAAVSQRVGRALRYPRRAQRAGTQGTAVVWVRLDRLGTLAHVALSEGSGSERLDQDALVTVERAAPFAPPPDALPDAALEFDIPVQYSLGR